jgi:integrase
MAQLELGRGPDGKRQRRSYYGRTRKEVADKLKVALVAQKEGRLPSTGTATLGKYLQAWLRTREASGRIRPSTLLFYRQKIEHDVIPALGTVRLDRLTRLDVDRLLSALRSRGLSARSVAHVRSILRGALAPAVRDGLLHRNVAADSEPPALSAAADTKRGLDPNESARLIAVAEQDRLGGLVILTLATGLRMGEVLGLRWQDVDLDAGIIQVRHAVQRQHGTLVLVEPKTERSRRIVKVPTVALDALKRQRTIWLKDQLLAGGTWAGSIATDPGPDDHAFTSRIGGMLSPDSARHGFERMLRNAGLPHMRFHDLRHSAATLLLVAGVPVRTVADVLGHSTTTLTLNTYAHPVSEMQRLAADTMDRLLRPPQPQKAAAGPPSGPTRGDRS